MRAARSGIRTGTAIVLTGLSLSCTFGPTVEQYTPAHNGAGIDVELEFDGRPAPRISGELLTVESASMLLVVHESVPPIASAPPTPFVARIHRAAIRRAEFAGRWRTRPSEGSVPERVHLSARYPDGVPPDLLSRLLAAYGQEAIVRYPPRQGDEFGTPAIEEFQEAAREATARFRDDAAALAEGYRPIGEDSPAMGRHWLNPALLFSADVSVERPAILTYIDVDGRRTLTGVAYAAPTSELDAATAAVPAPAAAWHVHGGALTRESHLPDHGSRHAVQGANRVAVLHAWVWSENPAGLFEPDNWRLPWERLVYSAPPETPIAAAKAAALCTPEGFAHFAFQAHTLGVGSPRPDEDSALTIVERVRIAVEGYCRDLAGGRADTATIAELARLWEPVAALGF